MPYTSKTERETQEFIIPPIQGSRWGSWEGLVKFDQFSRYGIDDTAADDLQNWIPQGTSMRQTPGNSANIATLPGGTAVWMSMQILNAGVYFYVLSSNGNIYQIPVAGGTITNIAGGSPTFSASTQITNWQGTTILFTDPNVSKVYSWNGTTFATVFASQQASFIAVYQGHLWMAQGSTITWTDTNTFNSLGGVSGSLIITDYDCLTGINALYPFNGLLYIFGPSFIQVIGNLSVSGSPAVLQFTKYTVEAQIGTVSTFSILPFASNLYFANKYGIWMMSGSVPIKVSQPLDGFWQNLDSASSFNAGYGQIYEIPCLFWNVLYDGDSPSTYRTFGLVPSGPFSLTAGGGQGDIGTWFSVVAGTVKLISSFSVAGVPNLYGCDGTNVFQMVSNASATVTSIYNSKYWLFGSPIGYDNIQYLAMFMVTGSSCTLTVNYIDDNGNIINPPSPLVQTASSNVLWIQDNGPETGPFVTWVNNSLATVNWTSSSATQQNVFQFDGPGRLRQFAINTTTTGTGIYLQNLSVGYKNTPAGWGS